MLHRTDYMSIIFQKKQGGASAMKSETSDVQRENKQEFWPQNIPVFPQDHG